MTIVGLLVTLVLVCLVLWAAQAIIGAFSVPQPLATVLYVAIVLIVVLWGLGQLGFAVPRFR